MKTIPFLYVCAVDRATFLILGNVVSCFYTSPPPLPPRLVESAVRFGTPKCEHLYIQGTTNSFILPQMSTLAILAVMLKRFVPKFTKQSHVRGMRGKNVLPKHVQDCKFSWTSAEPRCYPP